MNSTIRSVYMNILTELLKEEAPTLYVEDFVYYYNKAISEYLKTRYELFETTQQLSDDLRSWKKSKPFSNTTIDIDEIYLGSEENKKHLYRHLLGCVVSVSITRPVMECDQSPYSTKSYKATRMSSDIKNAIRDNSYLEPKFYRPYFEIINNTIKIDLGDINNNSAKISIIEVEYLCQPEKVDLKESEIKLNGNIVEEDTSQVLEFSKDVEEEITKVALKLILERGSSHRLQAHTVVNQSISDVSTGLKGK